jgi:CDP-glycerol glycerophosphotransferase (TagB/SpsB family)
MRVIFDIQRLYYLPHYEPVMHALHRRGVECIALSRDDDDPEACICRSLLPEHFEVISVNDENTAIKAVREREPDWLIVGNSNIYWKKTRARSALLYHGNGVKSVYYSAHMMNVDLRFVEGPYRAHELSRLFPQVELAVVGYPKLDPLLNGSAQAFDLAAHSLDPSRPTVLYAPTFFPSSIGCMPLDWPQTLASCNIIIKPHQFSLTHPAYRDHRRRFRRWASYPNVFLADTNHPSLLPFMAVTDILISEASTALFEFAALDRPIIWCDFLKLRWSYRGPFRYRLQRRMDPQMQRYAAIGVHAGSSGELSDIVLEELAAPERCAAQRHSITEELFGLTDGNSAERAADILANA